MEEHKTRGLFVDYPTLNPTDSSEYGEVFPGYKMNFGGLGSSTSPMTEMQLAEVNSRLNEGMRTVEMGTIDPTKFETIPQEHFGEMRQLAKLANADITMHAPMIDPSGFMQGKWQGEEMRQDVERQLKSVLDRAIEANPNGIPVNIHGAGHDVLANQWIVDKHRPVLNMITAVNKKTGEMVPIEREIEYDINTGKSKRIDPNTGEPLPVDPKTRLESINKQQWESELRNAQAIRKERDELAIKFRQGLKIYAQVKNKEKTRDKLSVEEETLLENLPSNKDMLNLYSEVFDNKIKEIHDKATENEDLQEAITKVRTLFEQKKLEEPTIQDALLNRLSDISKKHFPKLLVPTEEFALDKAAETFSNLAMHAGKLAMKNKCKDPIITIENDRPDLAFSRADKLRELVEESRKRFKNKLIDKGMDPDRAEDKAERMIGATWDIGHINQLKKFGFKEKEVIHETEKIARFVKHAHLHDNFGQHDSHLPVGMGNAPIKKFLEILKDEGFEGKAIIEGGAFAVGFKTSPQPYSLQNLDAPIYAPNQGGQTWAEEPSQSSYFSGFGQIFPQQHFSIYGGGFSKLPMELGGKVGGTTATDSTGTPNA